MSPRTILIALAVAALAGCSNTTPTGPSASGSPCTDVSGTYDVTYQSACATQYPKTWTLQQSGCNLASAVSPDMPTITGSVKANNVQLVLHNGFTACLYDVEGSGLFDGQTIRAQLAGKVSGPCCGDRTDVVTLVAVRRAAH